MASVEEGIGEVFNIGTDTEISVGELFARISSIMRVEAPEIIQDDVRLRPAGSEVDRLRCDFSKLRAASGYEPSVSLDEGLARTIDWMRDPAVLSGYKADIYNV